MRLCGQQAVWNYEEENGLLTIQGVGAMEDYTEPEHPGPSSTTWRPPPA